MYFAKQVPPQQQIAPFCGDMYPDVTFKGNSQYIDQICPEWNYVARFLRMADTYDYLSLSDEDLKWSIEEDLRKPNEYSKDEVQTIRALISDYQNADTEAKERSALIGILNIFTGQTWIEKTIRGCCQGEWQTIYYPEEQYSEQAINNLEIEYFNLGSDWIIHDRDNAPEKPEDVDGYYCYTHGWNTEMNQNELAEALGCNPEEIVMWEYDHDMIVPVYKKISAA